jgi:16S rRNA (guanine527-N7)-methyltransferase
VTRPRRGVARPDADPRLESDEPPDTELVAALRDSQRLGMLGQRPVPEVIAHAGAFVDALASVRGTVVDLGSGGGVPGLVIARRRPDLRLILVDRRARRTDHLRRLVGRLDLAARVEVLAIDATDLGSDRPRTADAVVGRGFGPPATTLRLAAPLLRDGGLLVISEPPTSRPDRWPAPELAALGLAAVPHPDRRVAVFRRQPTGPDPPAPSNP